MSLTNSENYMNSCRENRLNSMDEPHMHRLNFAHTLAQREAFHSFIQHLSLAQKKGI